MSVLLKYVDFKPTVYNDTWCCCFVIPSLNDPIKEIHELLEDWYRQMEDKINIINIETLPFQYNHLYVEKGHIRVWYYSKEFLNKTEKVDLFPCIHQSNYINLPTVVLPKSHSHCLAKSQ